MIELGYKLSSEEFGPADLVRYAVGAERAGFRFALISDHFHPWTDRQGQSPFVWTVIGAIANATTRLRLGTAVTCPTIRVHPAIIAQAAATTAALMKGRFFLGLGTGENLNEHVIGRGWPSPDVRLEMLAEAIKAMRLLWEGGAQSFHGRYYTVEDARLYTLPDRRPDLMIAASNPGAAAARWPRWRSDDQHRTRGRPGHALQACWRQRQAALRRDDSLLGEGRTARTPNCP